MKNQVHSEAISGLSRKKFLKLAGMGTLSLMAFTSIGLTSKATSKVTSQSAQAFVRIRPLPGKRYNPSFLKFCKHARFRSVEEAVRRMHNRTGSVLLVSEHQGV
jgi:hypothetical protein